MAKNKSSALGTFAALTLVGLLVIGTAAGLKYVLENDLIPGKSEDSVGPPVSFDQESSQSSDQSSASEDSASESLVPIRQNLLKLDFKTPIVAKELNELSALNYFNDSIVWGEKNVFKETVLIQKVFQDKTLKFGSASSLGFIGLDLFTGHEFNAVRIKASNYTALQTTTNVWSSDKSSLTINDSFVIDLPTNELDTSKPAATITEEFIFEDIQSELIIDTSGKRLFIYEMELWLN